MYYILQNVYYRFYITNTKNVLHLCNLQISRALEIYAREGHAASLNDTYFFHEIFNVQTYRGQPIADLLMMSKERHTKIECWTSSDLNLAGLLLPRVSVQASSGTRCVPVHARCKSQWACLLNSFQTKISDSRQIQTLWRPFSYSMYVKIPFRL